MRQFVKGRMTVQHEGGKVLTWKGKSSVKCEYIEASSQCQSESKKVIWMENVYHLPILINTFTQVNRLMQIFFSS